MRYALKPKSTAMAVDPTLDAAVQRKQQALDRQSDVATTETLGSVSGDAAGQRTSLLDLPNELLLQIAGYLETDSVLSPNDGWNVAEDGQPLDWIPDTKVSRYDHFEKLRPLWSLALTSNRLAAIAQPSLFRSVSLPQSSHPSQWSVSFISPVLGFLRTILEKPELCSRVASISLWVWKSKHISLAIGPLGPKVYNVFLIYYLNILIIVLV